MNIASIKYLIVAAGAAATSSISAQTMTDWGEITPGTVYEYEAKTPVAGFYVASSTGQIRCYSTGAPINAYSDAEHNVPIESTDSYYGPEGEKVRPIPPCKAKLYISTTTIRSTAAHSASPTERRRSLCLRSHPHPATGKSL